MNIEEYNEELKLVVGELESAVNTYDTLIKNAKSKDVSQMLISKRDEVIYKYDVRISKLNATYLPQEEIPE